MKSNNQCIIPEKLNNYLEKKSFYSNPKWFIELVLGYIHEAEVSRENPYWYRSYCQKSFIFDDCEKKTVIKQTQKYSSNNYFYMNGENPFEFILGFLVDEKVYTTSISGIVDGCIMKSCSASELKLLTDIPFEYINMVEWDGISIDEHLSVYHQKWFEISKNVEIPSEMFYVCPELAVLCENGYTALCHKIYDSYSRGFTKKIKAWHKLITKGSSLEEILQCKENFRKVLRMMEKENVSYDVEAIAELNTMNNAANLELDILTDLLIDESSIFQRNFSFANYLKKTVLFILGYKEKGETIYSSELLNNFIYRYYANYKQTGNWFLDYDVNKTEQAIGQLFSYFAFCFATGIQLKGNRNLNQDMMETDKKLFESDKKKYLDLHFALDTHNYKMLKAFSESVSSEIANFSSAAEPLRK